MKPFVLLAPVLALGLLTVGCSNVETVSKPATSEAAKQTIEQVNQFIAQVESSKNVDQVKQQFSLMMESLSAQADQFGGPLTEIHEAAQTLEAKLSGSPKMSELKTELEQFKTKISEISANL